MSEFIAKRRWSQEEIPVLCGSILCWYHPVHSSNSRPLWRKTRQSCIERQRVVTERLRRTHALDHSICIYSGLIPGGKDVKKGRDAVFFTAVNPMYIEHYREKDYDVTKPRIAVYTNTIGKYTKTQCIGVIWGLLREGLQFYQTWSNAFILYNTLPAMCIEKMVIRKSGEDLYSKTYQSRTAPQRIVLKPNLHYGRQDTTSSDARTSSDRSDKQKENCDGGTYKETCRGEIDFRIQGLPHSAVQEHDDIRKKAVQKLIHQFGNHPNQEAFQRKVKTESRIQSTQRAVEGNDLQHGKHGVLRDSRDHSKHTMHQLYDILADRYWKLYMRNMLTTFRQSSKTQHWPLRCFIDSQSRHQKGPSHGRRHGNTERQRIYHAAHVSSRKAKKKGFTSIRDRFLKCLIYRRSQLDLGLCTTGWDCSRGPFLQRTRREKHLGSRAEQFRTERTHESKRRLSVGDKNSRTLKSRIWPR